jgi:hypothetical protein
MHYTKFKVFRIRFTFDFKTQNFLKIASAWVRFALDSSEEQNFPESNLITADHVGKKKFSTEQIATAWF